MGMCTKNGNSPNVYVCALQASDLLNAAALTQLAAAEDAELSVRAALTQQVAAFEELQADNAALAQRMLDLQASSRLRAQHSMQATHSKP
jgi:uncharacterized membrane protein